VLLLLIFNGTDFKTGIFNGTDFKTRKIGIKIETKSKLKRIYLDEDCPQLMGLNREICLRLLARNAIKTCAFDNH
jgi:hypothetical protein